MQIVPREPVGLAVSQTSIDRLCYLTNHRLCSKYNITMLKDRLREIYMDMYGMCGMDFELPSINEIATEIDNENILTIEIFFRSYNYPEDEIDDLVSHYSHGVGAHLDITIEEVMREMAYPYRGSIWGKDQLCTLGLFGFPDESQYVIFPEFL